MEGVLGSEPTEERNTDTMNTMPNTNTNPPMKIELRRYSSNARLSEETIAYSADVYVDGVKVGHSSNHGTGGPDNVVIPDAKMRAKVEAFVKAQPPVRTDFSDEPLTMTMDLFFGLLAEAEENKKEDKKRQRSQEKFKAKFAKYGSKVECWVVVLKQGGMVSDLMIAEDAGATARLDKAVAREVSKGWKEVSRKKI